jgi:hypothetical protein
MVMWLENTEEEEKQSQAQDLNQLNSMNKYYQ